MLLKELVRKMPWESAFEGTDVHECWSVFKSTGTGNSKVSAVTQAGQKASLSEQESSRTLGGKGMCIGSKGRWHRRTTGMLFTTVGRSFVWPKLNESSSWPAL